MECHSLKLYRYCYHDHLNHKVLKLERRLAESHSQQIYKPGARRLWERDAFGRPRQIYKPEARVTNFVLGELKVVACGS